MSDICARLKEARINAGFRNAREAAERYGWTYTTYASHENGMRGIRLDDVRKYAKAFKVDIAWLISNESLPKAKGNGKSKTASDGPMKIPVAGKVAAGVWLESENYEENEEVSILGVPSSKFPNSTHLAFKVEGPSMNKVLPDGCYAVGVTLETARYPIHGDIVVVNRVRGGLHERTVKRYVKDGMQALLVPESDDPRFQTPISLDAPEDDTQVDIVAIITGMYQDL